MAKKKEKHQSNSQDKEGQKHKRRKVLAAVFVFGLLLVLVAVGLWKLSGENDKPQDKLVFTVGEEEVYLDEVNLCILQNVVNLRMTSDTLSNTTAKDGTDAAEYYKQKILELIMDYKVEYMTAKSRGIELTEDEEKDIRRDAVQYMGSINGSILKELGITQERVIEVYRQRYLAKKLEDTELEGITVDDQHYCTMYIMLFPKVEMSEDGDYKRQEDGETPVMLSDEEVSAKKADADAAYQELMAGADVQKIADKYGVNEYSGEESNLADSFGEPFAKYANSLKEGEYSPVLDIESAYAIVKMITVNNEELANQILEYYKSDLADEKIAEEKIKWYEEMGIEAQPQFNGSIWKNISLYDFTQYMEE
ncbi:MAG: peptidyl-prolyl cis-trans isomerase [Lachnospiraceae bacterium]|nr:peptidyl-prolyl cis-trans isomerase [Lachnospiraceae bacterium]